MNRIEAIKILVSFRKKIIKDVYDKCDEISEAILILRPDFEYPEWDNKTINAFLEDVGAQHGEWYW
jgi:hypothetical protein